jgi:hypothetical protein
MCVDAGHVGVDHRARVGVHRVEQLLRAAHDAERAQHLVGLDACGANQFGQSPVRDAPREVHLPQPVLRVYVAEREQRICLAGGHDVRDRVRIALDLHGRAEPGDLQCAGMPRQAGLPVPQAGGDAGRHQDQRAQAERAPHAYPHQRLHSPNNG